MLYTDALCATHLLTNFPKKNFPTAFGPGAMRRKISPSLFPKSISKKIPRNTEKFSNNFFSHNLGGPNFLQFFFYLKRGGMPKSTYGFQKFLDDVFPLANDGLEVAKKVILSFPDHPEENTIAGKKDQS
jgi:hypothetical protein